MDALKSMSLMLLPDQFSWLLFYRLEMTPA